jgi:hypothetical protein
LLQGLAIASLACGVLSSWLTLPAILIACSEKLNDPEWHILLLWLVPAAILALSGLSLGILVRVLAGRDLGRFERGLMDKSGEPGTRHARAVARLGWGLSFITFSVGTLCAAAGALHRF